MAIDSYLDTSPVIGANVFVHASAQVIGDVVLGDDCSVWPNVVIRGDVNSIRIGRGSNVQDLTICHVEHKKPEKPAGAPLIIGEYVTVGHSVILHGCSIGDEVLVGMGAIVMDGAVVGAQSIIGAGALLTRGLQVPAGSLVYGTPAKVTSQLGAKERNEIRDWAEKYCRVAAGYMPMIS